MIFPSGDNLLYPKALLEFASTTSKGRSIRGPEDVEAIIPEGMKEMDKEHFMMVPLDGRHRPICEPQVVSIGTVNSSIVHPREVFRPAILTNAVSVIVMHNHPSGDSTPSREDLILTKRLDQAGEILGIRVLDHVIVGEETLSLREYGGFDE